MNATRKLMVLLALVVIALPVVCTADSEQWTLNNIIERDYKDHCFRLPVEAPDGSFRVLEDGEEIPYTVDEVNGRKELWVRTTVPAGGSHTYSIESGKPEQFDPVVSVKKSGRYIELSNDSFAVRLPASASGQKAPCPIAAVKVGDRWVGKGQWNAETPLKNFDAEIIDDGKVFGRVRLRYEFEGDSDEDDSPSYAEVVVTVWPGRKFAEISEQHEMEKDDYWQFDMTAGWNARKPSFKRHSGGFSGGRENPGELKPNQNPYWNPNVYGYLIPRWNQHSKDGWHFDLTDGSDRLGVLVIAAGKWYWPHDNALEIRVRDSGDYAGLRGPTWRGRRYWFLTVGDNNPRELGTRYALESLDFLANELKIKDWPGASGNFNGFWPLGGHINPTGQWRGKGRRAARNAGQIKEDIGRLTHTQVLMHPNSFGSYWLFWSPQNPNFYTDYMKVPLAYTCNLRTHPQFDELAENAEQIFREDMYHSVTLPGGAGNECPGYQQYALKHYKELADVLKKYCDFDATQWPRFKEAAKFVAHISQPLGGGKRGLAPFGDTHPGYVFDNDPIKFAANYGVNVNVKELQSEELPGFGVVLRNNPGTDDETFFAFKSGPNRGHYHGDQLAFHWCDKSEPLVVDHHCSYHPRAGQEHMHNRVAFHTKDIPYANMDGYERVIAFENSNKADITIGQVSSDRLRKMPKLPPENWHQEHPQHQLRNTLTYRRTAVLVKSQPRDYIVLRDQYDAGGEPLGASYCLHVYGDEAKRSGRTIDFGTLKCYVAEPARFQLENFNWEHENGPKEVTKGCRLTVRGARGEFVTVLYPGDDTPEMETIPGGVRVGEDEITFDGGIDEDADTTYVTVRTADGSELTLTGADIDLNRSQGEVGLFVPDAGYPFGPIPEWLARQRLDVPDWAPEWVKQLRNQQ
ncbi:MAG: hypothetical protein ACOC9S_03000 [Planctomycetota bacterium]